MRKYIKILLVGLVVVSASCNKFLDVNDVNPNAPVDVTPDLLLPAALSQTANTTVTFNSYGAWAGGYQANGGGYGGFGSVLTYNYSTSDNNGLWSESFSNINDYQTIINKTDATGPYKGYNAIAKIMKAYVYIKLIDVYGDVPYTDAAKGLNNLTPKYDKAEDIYRALFTELDQAITTINLPNNTTSTIKTSTSPNSQKIDIIDNGPFALGGTAASAGNFSAGGYPTAKWVAFANTLKLKMLVRARAVPSFAATFATESAKLASATFVTSDVWAQPGYAAQTGKQNPAWNTYAYNGAGTATQLTTVPTYYAVGFYEGAKLTDAGRGEGVTYKSYAIANQLGVQNQFVEESPNGTNWYVGTGTGTSGDAIGILKGPTMAQPLMLGAESYFLQAEAALYGVIPGSVTNLFETGVKASFNYLYLRKEGTLDANRNVQTAFDRYKTDNAGKYLVNISAAGADQAKQLEAIITQKWIAVNYIHSNEGWSDYRRTGYPTSVASTSNEYLSFVSTQSVSTRPDRLPVRVLYPASEYSLNPGNAPSGISPFTSRIFYDLN
jgi:hypothetical protein